jgi:hypothetical protein
MSNSPLVVYTKLSPNHSGKRTKKIDTITIHCMAGNCSVETCGNLFANSARQASSNYGIGTDGRIALYVDEANRSWCTSSNANDQRAVTIEVANNGGAPDWPVSAKAYAALLDLVTDICKRNGIKRLVWSTSKNDRVNHLNGCNMTVHRDYANKSCPGDYLYNRHGQIAAEVNKRLGITDAGGSTGGQTSGNTETGLKVGDVVDFKGTQHYTSAAAKDAKTCKPGKATITAVAAGKAHPYHLKAISGGGSTVYGWVNAADISTGNTETGLKVGDVVDFKGTQHYTSAAAKDAKTCKPGKATITAVAAGKAHPYHLKAISGGGSTVYGWVNAADISTGSTGTATSYRVRTTADVLNIRKGPGTNYGVAGQIKGKGIYTIVAEAAGPGATKWGKLKSGAGWISLDYVTKL